jgi:hypothetical protein
VRIAAVILFFYACTAGSSKRHSATWSTGAAGAQTVKVDVSMSNQTFEGSGPSLAWFANSVGSWTNTSNQGSLMTALFSPSLGLGLKTPLTH